MSTVDGGLVGIAKNMRDLPREVIQKWICFVLLWVIMLSLEYGLYIYGMPVLSEELSIAHDAYSHYAHPEVPDIIPDDYLWPIFILSGLLVHMILRLSSTKYNLSTGEFVRIYGTITPILTIFMSTMKLTVCEPRPNFLARCLGTNDVIKEDISAYAYHMLGTRFNVSDCPNEDREHVLKGLLSMPSGHASQSFGMFTFIYHIISIAVEKDLHPFVLAITYIFPIICSFSRITDHQHHLHDVVIGALIGTFIGDYTFKKMMPNMNKKEQPKESSEEYLIE